MPQVAVVFRNLLEAIGNTPLQEVVNMDTGPCRLFLKLESANPGGSIKDRIAVSMIEAAEASGALSPGGTIIEATAGNTGLGLALVGAQKGYRTVLVVPDKMAREKIFHLRALGADVINTRSDVGKGHPEYYQDMAERLAAENGWYYINQFANPANPAAHEKTTGPEILAQCAQLGLKPDAVVCGVGSGGTITGLARHFAHASPLTRFILADPEGSILAHYVETGEISTELGSWLVEGIGEDFIPPVSDLSRVSQAYTISDRDAFAAVRALVRAEGILAGSSSGTLLEAALRYCRSRSEPEVVVTFVCDSGNKYLSKAFNDFWMIDNGFMETPHRGDLTDLVARKYSEDQVITIKPSTPLEQAYRQMKQNDVSQLPVMDGDTLIGLLDEEDLLQYVCTHGAQFSGTAADAMARDLVIVDADDDMAKVMALVSSGMVAPVMRNGRFQGLITRIDILNHLRLHPEDARC